MLKGGATFRRRYDGPPTGSAPLFRALSLNNPGQQRGETIRVNSAFAEQLHSPKQFRLRHVRRQKQRPRVPVTSVPDRLETLSEAVTNVLRVEGESDVALDRLDGIRQGFTEG